MKQNLYILLTLVFLAACESKESEITNTSFTEGDLPDVVSLNGHKYAFSQVLNPRGILVTDGKAIIFERKNVHDDKLHIIDLESMTYLQTKGKDGMGPGEVATITQVEALSDPSKFQVYDLELRLFSTFNFADTSRLAESQFKAPETTFYITNPTLTSDTTLLANTVDGWTKYLHLSISGDTLAMFGDWRDMIKGKELPNGYKEEELDANLVSNIFQGSLKASKDKSYAIKAGVKVDYIDIVNLETMSIKTIYGPVQGIPDFKISYWGGYQMPDMGPSGTSRYVDVFPGEKSFFALFFGKKSSEISDMDNPNRIFEFDYEGNVLSQYQLDYPLLGFSVDEESRAIYGVTIDREPNLVRFDY
ncbi:TolB-like 6-blade propeller-like [Algoriphagus locisalis]|uniref:TolB-like 6-blade propeller-like n=1 Tax=Algoriphagus locisalis TaxID=305507 RepID=A0A1I7A0F1_9BACT|nr:BF3164 family lipoprotein [Algoriphagus locisalis]SFT68382.1 TolB-like 6-blade propeller-like [Algoriphagus locisalis]